MNYKTSNGDAYSAIRNYKVEEWLIDDEIRDLAWDLHTFPHGMHYAVCKHCNIRIADFMMGTNRAWQTRLLVHSIVTSLIRGSLSWDDEKSWNLLEASYKNIKEGK